MRSLALLALCVASTVMAGRDDSRRIRFSRLRAHFDSDASSGEIFDVYNRLYGRLDRRNNRFEVRELLDGIRASLAERRNRLLQKNKSADVHRHRQQDSSDSSDSSDGVNSGAKGQQSVGNEKRREPVAVNHQVGEDGTTFVSEVDGPQRMAGPGMKIDLDGDQTMAEVKKTRDGVELKFSASSSS